ncbi:MAG: tryptophan-rich sensory protein [Gemmatimonadota bacterium]
MRWSAAPLRTLNVAAFLVLVAGNAWGAAGIAGGESIGVVANRWPTFLLPAGWTFGIWSLIYVALGAFAVYQALPRDGARLAAERLGPLWCGTVVLNLAWLTAFSFSRFGIALAVMAALLVSLILIFVRLDVGGKQAGPAERWLVQVPFSLYLGWITVAFIVNTAQLLASLGWEGGPLAPRTWAIIMMAVATGIAALFDVLRREWIVALVVAWALAGIGARYQDQTVLVSTAWGLAAGNVALVIAMGVWRSVRAG